MDRLSTSPPRIPEALMPAYGSRVEPPALKIDESEIGGVPVLSLGGELDIANVGAFADVSMDHAADRLLVVDLTELAFMDSSGLRELLRLVEVLGDQLLVVCPSRGAVHRLFEVAGVLQTLALEPTRECALRRVRASRS